MYFHILFIFTFIHLFVLFLTPFPPQVYDNEGGVSASGLIHKWSAINLHNQSAPKKLKQTSWDS